MASLYTRDGLPLEVRRSAVYNPSGEHFGTIQGAGVYDLKGRYRGTIVDGRLIYRSTDSAMIGGVSGRFADIGETAEARVAAISDWGDEPDLTA
jgi:hypothetical protein